MLALERDVWPIVADGFYSEAFGWFFSLRVPLGLNKIISRAGTGPLSFFHLFTPHVSPLRRQLLRCVSVWVFLSAFFFCGGGCGGARPPRRPEVGERAHVPDGRGDVPRSSSRRALARSPGCVRMAAPRTSASEEPPLWGATTRCLPGLRLTSVLRPTGGGIRFSEPAFACSRRGELASACGGQFCEQNVRNGRTAPVSN